MKGNTLKFIILLFFLLPDVLYSQTRITVTKPQLEVSDDHLIIQYDILNAKSTDIFIVWIEVTDAVGKEVKAISVTGDIGNDIKGGRNKRITWDLVNDSVYIDENIFVEVKAEKNVIAEELAETRTTADMTTKEDAENKKEPTVKEEPVAKEETKKETQTEEETETNYPINSTGKSNISKGNQILSSVVLPGWGQSKTNKSKPYWLIGAAGYGCLAGSVILGLNSSSVYKDYKTEMDPDKSNDLFETANQRKNISKYMAYSAIGIWAADIIWVLATPAKSSRSVSLKKGKELKILPGFDTDLNATMVSLTFKF